MSDKADGAMVGKDDVDPKYCAVYCCAWHKKYGCRAMAQHCPNPKRKLKKKEVVLP